MEPINQDSIADIVFQLKWESQNATHNEGYAAQNVNLWRDWLPGQIGPALMGKKPWEQVRVDIDAGQLFGDGNGAVTIDRRRFNLDPQEGRFYPRGRLRGIAGVFPQNVEPFRCVGINNGHMSVDLSHPLAAHPLTLSMTVGQISSKVDERGGSSVDWLGLLTDGPGMQARWNDKPTDFFSGQPFSRRDEHADDSFYTRPRLVHHVDETARDMIADLYKRFVKGGTRVLDLMTSWHSHLPEGVEPAHVSGLGLNATELEQNTRLTDYQIHDLNAQPVLPYADGRFDVVLCSLSVEYLTRPIDVFQAVARVLKPGGVFVVSFSNRWFPPKVISIWETIHEFERMGLVMEYFLRSGRFDRLGTYSMRGLPRPRDDKYAAELALSDPVFAVWGHALH